MDDRSKKNSNSAQTDETTRAQAAFLRYCGLGPQRSLSKLAEVLGKTPGYTRHLESWSSRYSWVRRAKEYDADILQKEADEEARRRAEAIKEMNARHAQLGTVQQQRAIAQIQELIEAKSFGALAAVQLLKLAIDIERNARDIPDKVEITGKDGGPIRITTIWGTPKVKDKTETNE
jgi:hypothetical protein